MEVTSDELFMQIGQLTVENAKLRVENAQLNTILKTELDAESKPSDKVDAPD